MNAYHYEAQCIHFKVHSQEAYEGDYNECRRVKEMNPESHRGDVVIFEKIEWINWLWFSTITTTTSFTLLLGSINVYHYLYY